MNELFDFNLKIVVKLLLSIDWLLWFPELVIVTYL